MKPRNEQKGLLFFKCPVVSYIHCLTESGNTWERFECLDENKKEAIKSKESLTLGTFVGTHGKEDCLAVCRIFGLTGCEWNTITGQCHAHMKKVTIGTAYKKTYCYTFNSNPTLGEIVLIIL